VKIVIVAKLQRAEARLTLEKWKLSTPPVTRPGATTAGAAAAAAAAEPQYVHTINIDRDPAVGKTHEDRFNPASFSVTSGDLRLHFPDIFLRQPVTPEADIVLDHAFLRE